MWPFAEWPWPRRIARAGAVLLRCSFCGKSQNDVRKLIAGPTVYICEQCIDLCNDILAEEREEQLKPVAEERHHSSTGQTGVAICRFCGLPVPMDFVVMILDRGYLCFACLDAIRAASEPTDGQ